MSKGGSENGNYEGTNLGNSCYVTHLLFVDNILIFYEFSRIMVEKLK